MERGEPCRIARFCIAHGREGGISISATLGVMEAS
jgi:hypothetical protein